MKRNSGRMSRTARILGAMALGLALTMISWVAPPVAQAATTFLVTTTEDTLAANDCRASGGNCSLRAAIMAANASVGVQDTITIPAGTYTLSISGTDNTAEAGDLDVLDGVTIEGAGPGVTIIQGGPSKGAGIDKVFSVNPNLDLAFDTTFKNLTIQWGKNTTDGFGGAMDWDASYSGNGNLTIDNCVIEENEVLVGDAKGGGIAAYDGSNGTGTGKLTITRTVFRDNHAAGQGGGLFAAYKLKFSISGSSFDQNSGTSGGGVFASDAPAGYTTSVVNTSFTGNTASGSVKQGGGMFASRPLDMKNVTFSGNSATEGGALWLGATATIRHATIYDNTPDIHGGASATFYNSIVSDGYAPPAVNGNLTVADPKLEALALNPGALGKTHKLQVDSPAKDTGDDTKTGGLTTDQLGQPRKSGTHVDAGAVEWQPLASTTSLSVSPATINPGQTVTMTATVSGGGGTVTFKDGGTTIGTPVTLSGGVASLTKSNFSVGTHSITAHYNGDTDFSGSDSSAETVTVNKAGTTTALTSVSPTPVSGETVTLSAAVTSGYSGTRTGTVLFEDGAATLGGGAKNVDAASVSVAFTAGNHALKATYSGDDTYASSQGTLNLNVAKASTTLVVAATPSSIIAGQTVVFKATAGVVAPGSGTPTGEVIFKDGATELGRANLNGSGIAQLPAMALTVVGDHSITAAYAGDANFNGKTSAVLTFTVDPATTTTTVVADPSPSPLREPVTFTVTVASTATGVGPPMEYVTLKNGTVELGRKTLTAGKVTFSASELGGLGLHTITAEYEGDGTFLPSTGSVAHTVIKGVSHTDVTANVANPVWGQPVTFTATVTADIAANGTPTGTIMFKDGTTELGPGTFAGGVWTLTTASLSVANHTITAEYSGDEIFAPSSGAHTWTVGPAATSVALVADKTTSTYWEFVRFDATVTVDEPGAGAPAGTVTFMEGTNELLPAVPVGTAWVATRVFSAGTHQIKAVYHSGNGNFQNSTSSAVEIQVQKAPTTTEVATGKATTAYGETFTLTATVTSGAGAGSGTPSGAVQFKADGNALGGARSLAGGSATLTVSDLGGGVHSITAEYLGAANFATSTSAPATQTVEPVDSVTTLTQGALNSVYGEGVALTVTVAPTGPVPAGVVPEGTVTFKKGAAVVDEVTLVNGTATRTIKSLPVGSHTITAFYNGQGNFKSSTSGDVTHTVSLAASHAALTLPASSKYRQSVTLKADVSAVAPGAGIPSGQVFFMEGETKLGEGTLDATGTTTLELNTLGVGAHNIVARYQGDAAFDVGASATGTITVGRGTTTVTLVPSTAAGVYHQTVTVTVTVTPDLASPETPSGTVSFKDQPNPLPSGTLDGTGMTTITLTDLSVRTHTISAAYDGDTTFAPSAWTNLTLEVTKAQVQFETTFTPETPVYGEPTTLLVQVKAKAPGSGTPTGTVTLKEGGLDLDHGTLTDGSVTFTLPVRPAGTQSFELAYAGDPNFQADSTVATVAVARATAKTTLVSSPNPAYFGDSVTFTATVTAESPGTGTPTGQVTFKVGDTELPAQNLIGGVATYPAGGLPTGSRNVTATYGGDLNFTAATSNSVSQSVQQATGALSVASPSAVYGTEATLTATLSPAAAGRLIEFFVDGASIGTAGTNTAGVASIKHLAAMAAGSHAIRADFAGDDDISAVSKTGALTVTQATGTVTVTPAEGAYRGTATLAATLTPAAPGRSIAFRVGGADAGSALTGADGKASVTHNITAPTGTATITATFAGDPEVSAATGTAPLTVNQAQVQIETGFAPASPVYGQPTAATITVTSKSPGGGEPTGTVTLKENGLLLKSDTLTGGSLTFNLPVLPVGPHSFDIAYLGDSNFVTGSAAAAHSVAKATAAASLTSSANPAYFGDSVTFTATVSAVAPGAGIPSGQVTFKVGTIETVKHLTGGVANHTVTASAVGSVTVTAAYSGDASFTAATSNVVTQSVEQAPGVMALASPSAVYGTEATLTATLTPPAAGKPIEFFVDGASIGTAATNAAGEASIQHLAAISAGSHAIRAAFAGDDEISAVSQDGTLTVTQAPGILTVTPAEGEYRGTARLEATLTPAAPARTIAFTVNGVPAGSALTETNSKASVIYEITAPAGPADITASFAGDAEVSAATNTATLNITQATSTIMVDAVSANPNADVTLKATLTPAEAGLTVTFAVDGADVGTATTDAAGIATRSYTLGDRAAQKVLGARFTGNPNIKAVNGTATLTIFDTKPVLAAVLDPTNLEGQTVDLTVSGSDLDGDVLVYSATGLPPGLGINAGTGAISGEIAGDAAGTYTVTVTVYDQTPGGPNGDTASQSFTWRVNDDLAAPAWGPGAALTATNVTETGLTLTWPAASDNVKVQAYKLYQGTALLETVTGTTTYMVTNLTKNTAYSFRVQAADPAGNLTSDGPGAAAVTALGIPDVGVSSSAGQQHLKAGETIRIEFPGQAGVTATYSLAYSQSPDNGTYSPGTPLTGSLTAGAGNVYAAQISVPAGAGYWKDLVLTVTATDATGVTTSAVSNLTYLVDTVAPAVTSAEIDALRPLKTGETFTLTVRSESGLTVTAWLSSPEPVPTEVVSLTEGDAGQYAYTYHVQAGENRSIYARVRLVDAAGNATEQDVTTPVVLDTTAPAITRVELINPPKLHQGVVYYKEGTGLTVEVTAETGLTQGAPGLQDVAVTFPGGSLSGLTDGKLHLIETGPATGIYRGTYTIVNGDAAGTKATPGDVVVTISDAAGNPDTERLDAALVVDTKKPRVDGVDHDARSPRPIGAVVRFTAWGEPDLEAVSYSFTLQNGTVRTGALTQVPTSPGIYEAFYTVKAEDETPAAGAAATISFRTLAGTTVDQPITHKLYFDNRPPVIGAVTVSPASGMLDPEQSLTISFTSEPGLRAVATVQGLFQNEPMTEGPAGTYKMQHSVRAGERARAAAVTVTAWDTPGNRSTATAADTVTIRTPAPAVNVGISKAPDGRDGWYVTAPVLTFAVDVGATLTLKDGGTPVVLGFPEIKGGTQFYHYTVPDGEHTYSYQAQAPDSLAATGALDPVRVDTVAPQAPVLTAAGTTTRLPTADLQATVRPQDAVTRLELQFRGRLRQTVSVTPPATVVAITGVELTDGPNTFAVRAYDAAGNASPASLPVTVTRDTTAPTFDITVDKNARLITVTPSETLATTPPIAVTMTADGTALTVVRIGTSYRFNWRGDVGAQAELKVSVLGTDPAGNAGTGQWVSARLIPARGGDVRSGDGNVVASFQPGALTDGAVEISSYSGERLSVSAYVPPGTQILNAYELKAALTDGAEVEVSIVMEMVGPLPAARQVGFYQMEVADPSKAPKFVPATLEVQSQRDVTQGGVTVTIYTVKLTAILPHFSVWAPFADGTAPDFTAAVLVGGAAAGGQSINTATATVTGTVDGTARTVAASLDGDAGATVATQDLGALSVADKNFTLTVPLGADGDKTITVKATDEFGNWRTQDLAVRLDTVAPVKPAVAVDGAPYSEGTTAATTAANVRLSGTTEGTAHFTVTGPAGVIAEGALGSFDVNLALALEANSTYTVVATDAAGNQSPTVQVIIRHDTVAPVVALTGINPIVSGNITFGYSVNEPVRRVELAVDGDATVGAFDQAGQTGGPIALTLPTNRNYTVTATVTDLAGNVTVVTRATKRDDTAPDVSLAAGTGVTNAGATLQVEARSGPGLLTDDATITIWLRGAVVPLADPVMHGGQYTHVFAPAALTEGENEVIVSIVGANAASGSATMVITKDTFAPGATQRSVTPARTNGPATVAFTLTETANAVVAYRIGAGGWFTDDIGSLPAGAVTHEVPLGGDGDYQFELRLTDAAGNTATLPIAGTVTIDKTNPVVTYSGLGHATGARDLTFGYSVNEPVQNVTLSVTGGASLGIASATDQVKNGISLHFPDDGDYTLTVTARDLAGNVKAEPWAITVDSKLPVVTATFEPELTETDATTLTITVGGLPVPDDATVAVTLGGVPVVLAKSHPTLGKITHEFAAADLAEGDQLAEVTVTGTNGLSVSVTARVTKDTIAPEVTGLGVASARVTESNATLNFTLSEPVTAVIERKLGDAGAWEEAWSSGVTMLPVGAQSRAVPLPALGIYEFRMTVTDQINHTAMVVFPQTVTRSNPPAPPAAGLTVSLAAAETLTRSTTVLLTGSATPGAALTISKGGQTLTSLTIGSDGAFQYTAGLDEGENSFTATATMTGQSRSESVTVVRDSTPPALSVTAEHSPATAAQARLSITTEPGATLLVDGRAVTVGADGQAQAVVILKLGTNEFAVVATDPAGNETRRTVSVTRDAPPVEHGPGPGPGPGPVTCAEALKDVANHWAQAEICSLVAGGIIQGFPDETFRPEMTVTRAQFMAMLARSLGLAPDPAGASVFRDEIPAWAQGYVGVMAREGLVRGDAEGTFRPDNEITRAELAVLMARVLAYKSTGLPPGEVNFTDAAEIPNWALTALQTAVANGLMNGFPDGSFQPGAPATRAQAAVLIRRLQVLVNGE